MAAEDYCTVQEHNVAEGLEAFATVDEANSVARMASVDANLAVGSMQS